VLAYIGRRALLAVFTVWAISVLSFAIIQLPPGDYVTSYIASMSASGSAVSEGEAQAMREQLMEILADDDLSFQPGGANRPLGELCRELGEVEYAYGARTATSRSTSPGEILPLLYSLAQVPVPTATTDDAYPGYPCVANAQAALLWFCGGLPLVIGLTWWWTRRPPRLDRSILMQEVTHADR